MKKQALIVNSAWFWTSVWGAVLLFLALLLPGMLVRHSGSTPGADDASAAAPALAKLESEAGWNVPLWMSGTKQVETLPLENYVLGVLAAEMPSEFQPEALKAQAMAARTYVVQRLLDPGAKPMSSDPAAEGALVSDTVAHQAFASDEQLRRQWGEDYPQKLAKLQKAVEETRGKVLTYEGHPINATFFSTSNGWTENSEDYWKDKIPYLRSVPSPWDREISPKYKNTVEISVSDFLRKMNLPSSVPVTTGSAMRVVGTTAGHRIKQLAVGGKLFTGRDVRERLNLPSSQFEWTIRKGMITFTSYGYGHGVGMSQWGAEGLARQGKSAEDIVKYYYTGIEIADLSSFLPPKP